MARPSRRGFVRIDLRVGSASSRQFCSSICTSESAGGLSRGGTVSGEGDDALCSRQQLLEKGQEGTQTYRSRGRLQVRLPTTWGGDECQVQRSAGGCRDFKADTIEKVMSAKRWKRKAQLSLACGAGVRTCAGPDAIRGGAPSACSFRTAISMLRSTAENCGGPLLAHRNAGLSSATGQGGQRACRRSFLHCTVRLAGL